MYGPFKDNLKSVRKLTVINEQLLVIQQLNEKKIHTK